MSKNIHFRWDSYRRSDLWLCSFFECDILLSNEKLWGFALYFDFWWSLWRFVFWAGLVWNIWTSRMAMKSSIYGNCNELFLFYSFRYNQPNSRSHQLELQTKAIKTSAIRPNNSDSSWKNFSRLNPFFTIKATKRIVSSTFINMFIHFITAFN